MRKLNVELYGNVLGTISQRGGRLFDFEADPGIFEKYQLSSTIMSIAVPLNLQYTAVQKRRAEIFFAEFLPEGRNLDWLTQSVPRSDQTLFGILRKYGKDIAGALSIYDPEDEDSAAEPKIEHVNGTDVKYLFEHMPQAALANSPKSGRTSLGGVQGKIVLAKKGSSWYRVHNGHPSTHILKPVVPEYPTMIYDEAFCMQVAQKCALTSHPVSIESFDGADALVIERYDRIYDESGILRIHQEDFNQALGARGSEKYQEYGGKVSAKRIAQTLARFGKDEDIGKFASELVFAIAIGNLDMHAKNVSILHFPDDSIALAPTYDQVPLRHQSTDDKMAFAINGIYEHANISLADIAKELFSWQCPVFKLEIEAADFVETNLKAYLDALNGVSPNEKAHPHLTRDISLFISNLLSGKKIGMPNP